MLTVNFTKITVMTCALMIIFNVLILTVSQLHDNTISLYIVLNNTL